MASVDTDAIRKQISELQDVLWHAETERFKVEKQKFMLNSVGHWFKETSYSNCMIFYLVKSVVDNGTDLLATGNRIEITDGINVKVTIDATRNISSYTLFDGHLQETSASVVRHNLDLAQQQQITLNAL